LQAGRDWNDLGTHFLFGIWVHFVTKTEARAPVSSQHAVGHNSLVGGGSPACPRRL